MMGRFARGVFFGLDQLKLQRVRVNRARVSRTARRGLEILEPRALLTVVTVDATASVHAINPDIYGTGSSDELGIDAPSQATLADLGTTVNRWGGNLASTYNWQVDAANHG